MSAVSHAIERSAPLADWAAQLRASAFQGDFENDIGAREVAATDNSIYQVRPLAIVYPRVETDVNLVMAAAARAGIPLCARGGNTGTNGQSLSPGVIVDFGRHMTAISRIEQDADGWRVTVQPGVVLDQLNAALAERGLFFPPMVSTASRATIGGMVATDASGKGSRRYGKTSDYIEAMDVVLSDGSDWHAAPLTRHQAAQIGAGAGIVADVHREALRVATQHAEEIERVFPKMNRGLTGYNLQRLFDRTKDRFFLAPLLAGSEGTLALTKSVTLRVIPKPACRALALVRYDNFDAGLRDVAARLLAIDPLAIEIVDDKILEIARTDVVWLQLGGVIGNPTDDRVVRAMNFVEFAGDRADVEEALDRFEQAMSGSPAAVIDWKVIRDASAITQLWKLREKSVGLLARSAGSRQGTAFVEDTAVPPEQLAAYVASLRKVFDRRGLHYGMFGHADVGCLHVRPLLDMKDPDQANLIRPISDEVAKLTKAHGGLLWGEHGRGYRGEYSPFFFGPTLYGALQSLKRAFDPHNRLNPGKLAAPDPHIPIDRIDRIPIRGQFDRQLTPHLLAEFDRSIACNGNAACFSWDTFDPMCPSYKATRDRVQSPKGRAALLRAWARLKSVGDTAELKEMEAAVAGSLSTCLSCKACTTLCPVKVDVPTMKSRFLDSYYSTRRRPARHHLLAHLEFHLGIGRRTPRLANLLLATAQRLGLAKALGLVDLPRFAPPRNTKLPPMASIKALRRLSDSERARTLVLLEDTFTSSFDATVVEAAAEVLGALGYRTLRVPPRLNGKALHVLGRRNAFAAIARERMTEAADLAAAGCRLVGLDAAVSLMYEQEYREFVDLPITVVGLETVLSNDIASKQHGDAWDHCGEQFNLLSHCTEQALRPSAADSWRVVLAHFGVAARSVRTGCCGMAGMFGHELEHQHISRTLFDLSWRDQVTAEPWNVLATGFSCRCQVERLAGFRPRHPVEVLQQAMQRRRTGDRPDAGGN